ncbi:tetratricopeptide (TPR) repeat protein/transcriptional regulator with XRE-family HTH domain [Lipingzhangella halophila]|uniref:Tetratricopeptide (TPR) repeat protein/transcriptional regulator with XRE-family HTH domain n=1 Tax=Lipingzhangella halophila TaxID=1783352 RepID=A0A7W7RND1_9ACTN|nr:helix-turn-helix domain-containing protein [Lipingzhangella halophila]MBB4935151.1 tetratricopeptide (TPR) repeat protein/transcriptional regulator with XRE-family HTH domain [Lipingzhangella halophila]
MSDTPSDFGAELRQLRLQRGISLGELARRTHYSKGHLSRIENGHVRTNATIARVCDEAIQTDGVLAALHIESTADEEDASAGESAAPTTWPLPPETAHFIGRSDELTRITRWFAADRPAVDAAAVLVISGMPGMGKTALAVRAARRSPSRFSDGYQFIDLHGYDGVGAVTAEQAADRLLRRLGVPGEQIPPHPDDRTAMLRQRLEGRELLLILDNASDSAQISPLLPASGGVRALVTSRSTLPALDEADRLRLRHLERSESIALLQSLSREGTVSGHTTTPVDTHVNQVADWCGGLPLAIRIAATVLKRGEGTDSDRWADRRQRLTEFDDGERRVSEAFDRSFDRLPDDGRRMFALCGLHPGTHLDVWTAAALAGVSISEARRLLRAFDDVGLLLAHGERIVLHDLVRLFARQRAHALLTNAERTAARARIVEHYLASVEAADRVLTPNRRRFLSAPTDPLLRPPPTDYTAALAWLMTELDTIVKITALAYESSLDRQCWQLAYALRGFLFIAKPWDAWRQTHETALAAALREGDTSAQAITRNNLGLVLLEQGDLDAAETHYARACELFRESESSYGEHTSIAHMAWVHFHRGDRDAALRDSTTALRYFAEHGNPRNRAIVYRDTASIAISLGRYRQAIAHLNEALTTFRELGLHVDTVMALNNLGDAYQGMGLYELAKQELENAVDAARRSGSRYEQARSHERLAELAAAANRNGDSVMHAQRAIELYSDVGNTHRARQPREETVDADGNPPAENGDRW